MILATLTLSFPLAGVALHDGEDDVARIVDVSSLATVREPIGDDETGLSLLPLMRGIRPTWADEEELSDPLIAALAEVFMSDFGDEVERFDVFPNGQVYIVGTEAAVKRFGTFVEFFEAVQASGPELELIRFRAPLGSVGGEIERDTLLQRLSGMDGGSARRRISIPFGGKARVFDQESTTISAAARAEIAQGMAIHYAETLDALSGFELLLATGPVGDQLRVAYVVSQLDRSRRAPQEPVAAEVRLSSTERGFDVDDRATWREPHSVAGGSLAGELRLRPGRFAVLQIGVSDGIAHFIAIGLARGVKSAPMLDTGTGQTLRALGRGALGRPHLGLEAPPSVRAKSYSLDAGEALGDDVSIFRAYAYHTEWDLMQSVFEDLDASLMEIPGGMVMSFENGQREEFDRRLVLAEGTRPAQLAVQVRASAGAEAPTRAGALLTTSGSRNAVVLGEESLTAKRYEVEVAQSVASREPVVITHFQGLCAEITLSKLRDGRLAYSVKGQLTEDVSANEASANSLGGSGLVSYRTARLGLDSKGVTAPKVDGSWKIQLGDVNGMRGSVEFTVTELE